MSPSDYVAASAITIHAILKMSLDRAYPELADQERDEMFVQILDRAARMRGWSLRREFVNAEDDE